MPDELPDDPHAALAKVVVVLGAEVATLIRDVDRLRAENVLLGALAAAAFAEIARLHLDPRQELGRMAATVQGMAAGIVDQAKAQGLNQPEITQVVTALVDRVVGMTEVALQPRQAPGRR